MDADGLWRMQMIFQIVLHLVLRTGEPMVALALLSLSCVVVRLFSFLLFSFLLCCLFVLGDVYL